MTDRYDTCAFCPAERHTSLWVKLDPFADDEVEMPVCIDCVESFDHMKKGENP